MSKKGCKLKVLMFKKGAVVVREVTSSAAHSRSARGVVGNDQSSKSRHRAAFALGNAEVNWGFMATLTYDPRSVSWLKEANQVCRLEHVDESTKSRCCPPPDLLNIPKSDQIRKLAFDPGDAPDPMPWSHPETEQEQIDAWEDHFKKISSELEEGDDDGDQTVITETTTAPENLENRDDHLCLARAEDGLGEADESRSKITPAKLVKGHLFAFLARLRRAGVSCAWILEFTKAGNPHFHLFFDWLPNIEWRAVNRDGKEYEVCADVGFARWFVDSWMEVSGQSTRVFHGGGIIEKMKSPDAAGRYVAKEAAKRVQKSAPEWFGHPGRFWGMPRSWSPKVRGSLWMDGDQLPHYGKIWDFHGLQNVPRGTFTPKLEITRPNRVSP